MATVKAAIPQFLVDDLDRSLTYYQDRLGFAVDFVYDDFYASVSRDGAVIHLKEAPKVAADRAHRRDGEHLDAFLPVTDIDGLHEELVRRGTPIAKSLAQRPWGVRDFYLEDPDGYILAFAEPADTARR